MQSLTITDPDRNPNSYTRDEILKVLRADSGSRRLTYRYDHLDINDSKIRDISHLVESGNIEVNELASIKRTATFTLRDDGEFNFLIDRIKPWCRVYMPPRQLTVTSKRVRRWFNTFNGTLGVTGDETFSFDITEHNGHNVDSFGGTLALSDDWSALGDKSLKVGADASSDSGSITIEAVPETRWAMTGFLNIAASGSFTMEAGTDETLVFLIDDSAGTYSFGSLDLSSISGDIVGQPVRMAIDSDGSDIRLRLYWTDIHGDTPDYDESFTVSGSGLQGSFFFEGGGDPAVFLDHLFIYELQDTPSQTSDDVNFVDFPLGVFILETTTQNIKADGTQLLDVEAYDKLKILEDDGIVGRLDDSGVEEADDDFRRSETDSWGETPDGLEWEEVNIDNADTEIGVSLIPGTHGWIDVTGNYLLQRHMLLPGEDLESTEIYTELAVNRVPASSGAYFSIVTRYNDLTGDMQELVLVFKDDEEIRLEAWSGGVQIGSAQNTGMMYDSQFWISVRTRTTSDRMQASIWSSSLGSEPEQWGFTRFLEPGELQDPGRTGLAAFNPEGADIKFMCRRFVLNSNPLNYYQRVIEGLIGDHPKRIAPTDRVIPTTREWQAGTSKRVIINELLSQINYHSLSVDEDGVFYANPYILPEERTAEFTYADDQFSVMLPDTTREFDLHNIANRWVMVQSIPDQAPITVVYENNDPTSPLSIQNRGRVITRTEGVEDEEDQAEEVDPQADTEASNKADLIKKAIRLGNESTKVYEHIDFETAFMPFHSSNDCYRLERQDLNVKQKYLEHKWSMNLEPGATMQHRARRIVRLDVSFDDSIVNDDLEVTGVFTCNNMAWGTASVSSPPLNTPVAFSVTGLELEGEGDVHAFTTCFNPLSAERIRDTSANYPTDSGFTGLFYRINASGTTTTHWFIIKEQ